MHGYEGQGYRGVYRRFQLDNQTAIDTLSSCATDASHFYNSSTGDALKAAFKRHRAEDLDALSVAIRISEISEASHGGALGRPHFIG